MADDFLTQQFKQSLLKTLPAGTTPEQVDQALDIAKTPAPVAKPALDSNFGADLGTVTKGRKYGYDNPVDRAVNKAVQAITGIGPEFDDSSYSERAAMAPLNALTTFLPLGAAGAGKTLVKDALTGLKGAKTALTGVRVPSALERAYKPATSAMADLKDTVSPNALDRMAETKFAERLPKYTPEKPDKIDSDVDEIDALVQSLSGAPPRISNRVTSFSLDQAKEAGDKAAAKAAADKALLESRREESARMFGSTPTSMPENTWSEKLSSLFSPEEKVSGMRQLKKEPPIAPYKQGDEVPPYKPSSIEDLRSKLVPHITTKVEDAQVGSDTINGYADAFTQGKINQAIEASQNPVKAPSTKQISDQLKLIRSNVDVKRAISVLDNPHVPKLDDMYSAQPALYETHGPGAPAPEETNWSDIMKKFQEVADKKESLKTATARYLYGPERALQSEAKLAGIPIQLEKTRGIKPHEVIEQEHPEFSRGSAEGSIPNIGDIASTDRKSTRLNSSHRV